MASIKRIDLYEKLKEKKKWNLKFDHAVSFVERSMGLEDTPIQQRVQLKKDVVRECAKIKEKLDIVHRIEKDFLSKNKEWLNKTVSFSYVQDADENNSEAFGRPSKVFEESSDRGKRRKTQDLRGEHSTPELSFATKMKLRTSGKIVEANLLDEMLNSTPSRAKKISSAWKSASLKLVTPLTPQEGLATMLDANLSRCDYQKVRLCAKRQNADIFPNYKRIRTEKKLCYPPTITVTEDSAKVNLQSLLDHTAERICQNSKEVLDTLPESARNNLVLVSKWGCDGSSNQPAYKQKSEKGHVQDSSLFMTCLVPLQLYTSLESECEPNKLIVWHNKRPNSTRTCRPVKIQHVQETEEIIRKETEDMQKQIDLLAPTVHKEEGYEVTIVHELCMTMIDGKVCKVITDTTSTSNCVLCGATPKMMNQIANILKRPIKNKAAVELGLSTLHAWIRFLEWLLHVSYRLDIKQWQVRGDLKNQVEVRKRAIQEQFRAEAGLLVDVVKQGFGTTNDGNTARRFFRDAEMSARITGLDMNLIHRCSVILRTLASGYDVNPSAFHKYSLETAELYVSLYPWFYMPASVHKVLIHGEEIIKTSPLPIGMMSEEAQEARNKDFRYYRRNRSRKNSRKAINEDVFHLMLVSSDPVISSLRETPKTFHGSLSEDVVRLLRAPSIPVGDTRTDESDSQSDEDED